MSLQLLSDGLLPVPVIRCYPGMRGYQTVPDRAVGTTVASSASANAYGAAVQITAGLSYDAYLVGALMGSPGAAASDAFAQLGILLGSSGPLIAEAKLLAHFTVTATGEIAQTPVMFPFPVFVPAGVPVRAQAARSVATAVSYLVSLLFVPVQEVTTLARVRTGIDAGAKAWPDAGGLVSIRTFGTGRGGSIVAGAALSASASCTTGTSPAYGAYAQINAALKYDFLITHLIANSGAISAGTFIQVGLGIGASGAEFPISDIIVARVTQVTATGELTWGATALPIGLLVPAGARLAARAATSGAASGVIVDVSGYYVRDLDQETSGP